MLTFLSRGRLSLEEWVYMHSTRPAQIWGLYPQKGSLLVGTDADFTIVDPQREWTLNRESLRSKSTATPFAGERFTGKPTKTVVRGEIVYEDGEVKTVPGHGQLVPSEGTVDDPRPAR
jgi:dihydroorotase/allantoinase